MNSVAYITHPSFLQHEMGRHHPESPARLHAISDQLIAAGIEPFLLHRDAIQATREQIERVHEAAYVDEVFETAPQEGLVWLDGDTAMNPDSLEAALHAAGANVQAVDMVMAGEARRAFCAVRPPGHHAGRDRAMGFCIFNNIAVGAAHAIAVHGLERVAIVDFDVHHGNGTEDIFSGDSRILLCSTFQHPFYPGTGAGDTAPNIVNCPLPAMTDGADFRAALRAHWLPALEAFEPQLILVSAGFDGHIEDDMAQMRLREPDYEWVTLEICDLANRHADGRVVSTLEGGYNLSALGRSVAVHIRAMMD
ncbi:MAG: histone deacetylase family protein [Gammaproteobacteria bacterium]|jgi:acetoin utilization deacetylase AcuC-like enzyme